MKTVGIARVQRKEHGFSMIKLLIILAVLGGGVVAGFSIFPVYNTYWKIQDTFEAVAREKASASESQIRKKIPDLLSIKYLEKQDYPEGFLENMEIEADGSHVTISSFYHVTVWLLGPVSEMDEQGEYDPEDLKGMDILRHKLRQDFDFEPYGETP